MIPNSKDICDLILPVLTIWKYTGLPSYKLDIKARKFTYQKSYSWLVLILFFSIYIVAILQTKKVPNEVENFMELIQLHIGILQQIGIFLVCYYKRHHFSRIISNCLSIESRINQLTAVPIPVSDLKIKLKKVCGCLYFLIFVSAIGELITDWDHEHLATISTYIWWYYEVIAEHFLIYLLTILQTFYSHLIKHLTERKHEWIKIKESIKIFGCLYDTSLSFNDAFGGLILLKFWGSLIYTTHGTYIVIVEIRELGFTGYWQLAEMSEIFFWTLIILCNNVYVINGFDNLLKQEELLSKCISKKLESSKSNSKVAKQNKLFLIKLCVNQLKFSVCRMFPLNRNLIFMYVSSSVTYLVWLIQTSQNQESEGRNVITNTTIQN